jgi:murein DD-endopeptidase MepM/ murein hydrolase activator NlpD
VAALSMAQAVAPPLPAADPVRLHWRERLLEIDWAPDLARDIGSRRWWRGFATLSMLCGTAIASWPGIRPVEAMAAPMPAADWEEARALTITPLAWGADTGRRMAPTDAVQRLAVAPERPRVELTATLGQGDSFTRVLERAGIGGTEARRIGAMAAAAIPLGDIAPGTKLDIVLGRRALRTDPRPVESLAFRAALDLRLEFAREANSLRMDRIAIAVDDTPLRIRGRVGSSLYRAARAAGAPPSAIQSYLRVIAGQLSVGRDINADDEYDIIVAHRRAETGETEVGELIFAGLHRNGEPKLRMLPWTVDGNRQWFEASGVGQQRSGLSWPVQGRITSGFGARRHPILGYRRMHNGMDFGAPHGAPIYAVTDGTVSFAGYNGGYGRFVKLSHADGLGSGYGHMSRIAVSSGQRVRRGQVIGYVGSTGLSTGPHLHYELYRSGRPVNPASVRFTTRAALSGSELAAFRARINQMAAVPIGGAMRQAVRPAAPSPAVLPSPAPLPSPAARAAR